jgi:hypothetical protein
MPSDVLKRVPDVYHPSEFWSKPRLKHTYLRLSRMARDLFTIPAMSGEMSESSSPTAT